MTSFVEKIVQTDRELTAAGIGHAFGGAICLGYHVESPRATADIDINVTGNPDQARPVLRALPAGIGWDEADLAQIRQDGQVRVFWDRTPVDLFFPQHELHSDLVARIEQVPFAETTIPVLSATDLTIFKALFDRPKDWVDIAEMISYGEVDQDLVRTWLVRILGRGDDRLAHLERALRG